MITTSNAPAVPQVDYTQAPPTGTHSPSTFAASLPVNTSDPNIIFVDYLNDIQHVVRNDTTWLPYYPVGTEHASNMSGTNPQMLHLDTENSVSLEHGGEEPQLHEPTTEQDVVFPPVEGDWDIVPRM